MLTSVTTEQDPYAAPNTAYLNFARLIQRYVRPFAHSAPQDALQYIYLIALNRDVPAPAGSEQRELCLDTIRDLVLNTKSYALLLGSVRADGSSVVCRCILSALSDL
jgi:nuclear pore complex protein Nup93